MKGSMDSMDNTKLTAAASRLLADIESGCQALPPGLGVKSWTVLDTSGDLVRFVRAAAPEQLIRAGLVAWEIGHLTAITAIDGSEDICEMGRDADLVEGTRYICVGQGV